jgi:two-component system, NarL family, invasion response regulator UvrY
MIKVLIADDHALIREGFKKILSEEIDIKVVAAAENGFMAIDHVKKNDVDVVILDVDMPGKSGLETIIELKQIKPNIKVLILSIHPEDRYALRAMKLGALAYLTKESAPEELVRAIRKIYTGQKYISEKLSEKLFDAVTEANDPLQHETLSEREYQVLLMISKGCTVSQIADQLCLSISTINTYRNRLLEKLGERSNAGLIRYSLKHGLVD